MRSRRSAHVPRVALIIDTAARQMEVAGQRALWQPTNREVDEALTRYLAFVAEMRNLPEAAHFRIRSADIAVLSDAFGIAQRALKRRLVRLQRDTRVLVMRRRLRGGILLPPTGLVLAATSKGSLTFVNRTGSAPTVIARLPDDSNRPRWS